MASTRANMKGFYRQKKKDAGIVKPSAAAAAAKKKTKVASDLARQAFLQLNDEVEKREDVLRQFDMNMVYGMLKPSGALEFRLFTTSGNVQPLAGIG